MSARTVPVTPTSSKIDTQRERRVRRGEVLASGLLFVLACIRILRFVSGSASAASPRWSTALSFFMFLALSYFGLSIRAVRMKLRSLMRSSKAAVFLGPGALLAAALACVYVEGLPLEPRAVPYAVYLFVPAVILFREPGTSCPSSIQILTATAALWLPIEFHLLPSLPLPPPDGYDAFRLVSVVAAFFLFLVARPIGSIGYTFLLERRDFARACLALAVYAIVAAPLGLFSHFLKWNPQVTADNLLLLPVTIYLLTAVPEEFLFRGVIQNLLMRLLGPRAALLLASVVFGLAHLPDLRYVVLATFAGVAYGWVYARTGKVTASALTHAGVDWIWLLLLRW